MISIFPIIWLIKGSCIWHWFINVKYFGYVDKKVCFIDNALPGEVVEVELDSRNRKFLKGKVVKYVKTSPEHFCSPIKYK